MMELWQSLFGQLGPESFTAKLAKGDQGAFGQLEAPALKQFGAIQGNLASRFSGMGLGGRKSSGFINTSNQAASDFAQQLQSNRMSLQQQALKDLLGLSNTLLQQNPYETSLVQKQHKPGWGSSIGSALGGLGGFALGGPSGGLSGAQLGSAFGSGF